METFKRIYLVNVLARGQSKSKVRKANKTFISGILKVTTTIKIKQEKFLLTPPVPCFHFYFCWNSSIGLDLFFQSVFKIHHESYSRTSSFTQNCSIFLWSQFSSFFLPSTSIFATLFPTLSRLYLSTFPLLLTCPYHCNLLEWYLFLWHVHMRCNLLYWIFKSSSTLIWLLNISSTVVVSFLFIYSSQNPEEAKREKRIQNELVQLYPLSPNLHVLSILFTPAPTHPFYSPPTLSLYFLFTSPHSLWLLLSSYFLYTYMYGSYTFFEERLLQS